MEAAACLHVEIKFFTGEKYVSLLGTSKVANTLKCVQENICMEE
jgi:hypothetical protein